MLRRRRRRTSRELVIEALSGIRRAQARIKVLAGRLAASQGDPEAGRMLESLYMIELVLERIAIRLETLLLVDSITGERLSLPYRLLKEVASMRLDTHPELQYTLSIIYESLNRAMVKSGFEGVEVEAMDEEVKSILSDAREYARRRVRGA